MKIGLIIILLVCTLIPIAGCGGGSSSSSSLGSSNGITVTSVSPNTITFNPNGSVSGNSFTVTGTGFTSAGYTLYGVVLIDPNSVLNISAWGCTVVSATDTKIVFSIPATHEDTSYPGGIAPVAGYLTSGTCQCQLLFPETSNPNENFGVPCGNLSVN